MSIGELYAPRWSTARGDSFWSCNCTFLAALFSPLWSVFAQCQEGDGDFSVHGANLEKGRFDHVFRSMVKHRERISIAIWTSSSLAQSSTKSYAFGISVYAELTPLPQTRLCSKQGNQFSSPNNSS